MSRSAYTKRDCPKCGKWLSCNGLAWASHKKACEKRAQQTKTFRRQVVIKDCAQDFGLGIGVLVVDEITYTDKNGRGFDSDLFLLKMQDDADELIKSVVTVMVEEKAPNN